MVGLRCHPHSHLLWHRVVASRGVQPHRHLVKKRSSSVSPSSLARPLPASYRTGYPVDDVAYDGRRAAWPSQKVGWGRDETHVRVPLEEEKELVVFNRVDDKLAWGAVVTGIKLDSPVATRPKFLETLADAIHRFQLVLFKRQRITPARHVELAQLLAPYLGAKLPVTDATSMGFKVEDIVPNLPQIAVLGSKTPDFFDPDNTYGKPVNNSVKGIQWPDFGPCSWHCDGAAFETPGSFTFVHMPKAPELGQGGATLYCNGYEIFDNLPSELQKRAIEASQVKYVEDGNWKYSYDMKSNGMRRLNLPGEREPSFDHVHPLVPRHPVTKKRAVWCAPANVQTVEDQDLVERCLELGVKSTYAHFYDDGDVCISDDRCMLHSTTPFSPETKTRILHRCGTELRSSRNQKKTFQYLYNVAGSGHKGKMSFKPGTDVNNITQNM